MEQFPAIDMEATGRNIVDLRKAHGFSVRDLQRYFGFEEPQAIYKWQRGQSLPTVDNLFALSALLNIPMNDILISVNHTPRISFENFVEQQADVCCSPRFRAAELLSRLTGSIAAVIQLVVYRIKKQG